MEDTPVRLKNRESERPALRTGACSEAILPLTLSSVMLARSMAVIGILTAAAIFCVFAPAFSYAVRLRDPVQQLLSIEFFDLGQ
ncbi:MAG: hypothetical protein ABF990_11830 [Acetobacter sp.]|uniref:hypothetical protein n=1 Tax=Acetobacter sp. TaxID=440 RepID=UPI0039ED0DF9